MKKENARKRRGARSKAIIRLSNRPRLVVHRTNVHMYAAIVKAGANGDVVLATSSTCDKALKSNLNGNKIEKASQVGAALAQRAIEQDIKNVAFDRAGYKYHGRVKALAEAAREAGLNF